MSTGQADEPKASGVLLEAIRAETAKIRVEIPGRIIEYTHDEQRAKVQPVIQSRYRDGDDVEPYMPEPIENCPVQFPQGKDGETSITWPLDPGDWVTLEFCSRSLDEWLTSGGTNVEPADTRRHDISDVIVDPSGPRPFSDTLPDKAIDTAALVFRSVKKIVADADGDIELDTPNRILEKAAEIHLGSENPGDWLALASLVKQELKDLKNAIDNFVSTYNGHQHQQVMPMIPTSPGPTPGTASSSGHSASKPQAVDDVKSSKVKSE
ncbi:MAG: Gp138 family membrane-puncturing spike protein [Bradymonadaceae bacterium]